MKPKNTVIGIDLGGTTIRTARVNKEKIEQYSEAATPQTDCRAQVTIDRIKDSIRAVLNDEVTAIGIGVPSVVDRIKGIAYNVMNIPGWDEVLLKEILEKEFSLPVYVDNDANCFALGERYFGAGKEYENFVGLTIGTGLGGGIIQQGTLLEDANCGSGEFGLLPYKDRDLEYYCSGTFFMNCYQVKGKEMYGRAKNGDEEALEAYRELGFHMAQAIKMVMYTIDPEMIVFGGSVAAAHSLFEESMWQHLEDFAYPNSVKRLKVYFSTSNDSGILGAAALALDK